MNGSWLCLKQQRFEYQGYALLPILHEHIEPIRCWRNAQLDVLRQENPISPAQQETYFTQSIWPTMTHEVPQNILMSLLFEGRLIGYGGLVHIGWSDQRAEMSFLVDDLRAKQPVQYARDLSAFITLVRMMTFDDLGFHKLFTETYANRHHHIQILELGGFQREGVLRDHVRIGGVFFNSIIHSIVQS
ncbi:MAG: GNAT family N-acetyltransferase [Cyanobacteria bacterium K_DeepCast_35m_m2_023]|nr:GNAT family N-acetyltransferase [Cyanobacteria bacterium K_DeepCast_35m_m2_023]